MNPLEAGKEAIEAICRPLREEKQKLLARIEEIEAVLEPLELALKPLGGNGSQRPTQPGRKPSKTTVNQENVRRVMLKVVSAKPGIDEATLKAKTKQIIKEQLGLDLKGYVNRCREVLEKEPFTVTADGRVHLTSEPQAQPTRPEATVTRPEPKLPVERTAPSAGPALMSGGESRQSETA